MTRARDADNSARVSAFAMAAMAAMAAIANAPIRSSVPAGSGSGREEPTNITPHSCPPARTGVPTATRTPTDWAYLAIGPPASP